MNIDESIVLLIKEEAARLNLHVLSIKQRYEGIDEVVTMVCLDPETENETWIEAMNEFEEAVYSLESQVIVVKESRNQSSSSPLPNGEGC